MSRFTILTTMLLAGCSFDAHGLGDESSTGDTTGGFNNYPDAGKRTAPMEPSEPDESSTTGDGSGSSSTGALEGSTSTGEASESPSPSSTGEVESNYGPCETDADCGLDAKCRVGLSTAVCAPQCEGQNCAPFEDHDMLCAVDACLIVCTADKPCPEGMACSLSSCTWSTL